MSHASRPPGARQEGARCGSPCVLTGRRITLGRLFSLLPDGSVTSAHVEPIRRALLAARIELDALRFAAEDAVDARPMMSAEAQRADVHARGAAVWEALAAAEDELQILIAHLGKGAADVS